MSFIVGQFVRVNEYIINNFSGFSDDSRVEIVRVDFASKEVALRSSLGIRCWIKFDKLVPIIEADTCQYCLGHDDSNTHICKECREKHFHQCSYENCEACGVEGEFNQIRDIGYFCDDHIDRVEYTTCDNCDSNVHCNAYDFDRDMCNQCCENEVEIPEHGSAKDEVFIDYENLTESTPLFGIELEVEYDGSDLDRSNNFKKSIKEVEGNFHYEEDGSLDDGFEMITDALTLESHYSRYNRVKEVFAELVKNKFVSHDNSNCGLHVHVSRRYLNNNHIAKMLNFLKDNQSLFERLARRRENQYCYYKKAGEVEDRYTSINIENDETIEFRIFRGTLKPETYYATLELVDAVVKYAVKTRKKMTFIGFIEFIKNNCQYKYLGNYFENRKINSKILELYEQLSKIDRQDEINKVKRNMLHNIIRNEENSLTTSDEVQDV